MSTTSGIFETLLGGAAVVAGLLLLNGPLLAIGGSLVLSGVTSIIRGNTLVGIGTASRTSNAPWRICYGRNKVGGQLVYYNVWGKNNQILDLVVILAAHKCQSVDAIQFDNQRLLIDSTAIPNLINAGYYIPSPVAGSGTSSSPLGGAGVGGQGVSRVILLTSIVRSSYGVVTATMADSIPGLLAGDKIGIQNCSTTSTNDAIKNAVLSLNGTFQVAEIISSTSFTYLNGGLPVSLTSNGQAVSKFPDYMRTCYVEYLLGNQPLANTFLGMTAGVPFGGTGSLCTPETPNEAGGSPGANLWTNYASLQGKTAAFVRLQYNQSVFTNGLPNISFLIHGKNDVYDPRLGSLSGIGAVAMNSGGSGYTSSSLYLPGDILTVVQSGASNGKIQITNVDSSGVITSFQVYQVGTGYSLASNLATTGGSGSGAHFSITELTGETGSNVYTENPALCIADVLTDKTFGFQANYVSDVPLSQLEAAANICDEHVSVVVQPQSTSGGFENRYTCNGSFELTQKRGQILEDMLTSCGGRLLQTEGQYIIVPAPGPSDYAPISTAADLQALSVGPIKWNPTGSISELYNGAKGSMILPESRWGQTDISAYVQDADHGYSGLSIYNGDINLPCDNGDRRWLELTLPYTISSPTAQRLCKIALLRSRHLQGEPGACGTGTFTLSMAAYQYLPLDIIKANCSSLGWTNKELEIVSMRFLPKPGTSDEGQEANSLAVEMQVREIDSSIFDWSTTEELTPQGYRQANPAVNTVLELEPFPWSPGYANALPGDSYNLPASFGLQPQYAADASGNPTIQLQLKGTAPINVFSEIGSPSISCTAGTSGSLAAGTYVVALAAWDNATATRSVTSYLDMPIVQVPASGSITVAIDWGSGDDGGDLYLADWNALGSVSGTYIFHHQATVASSATTATIFTFDKTASGGCDSKFDHFEVTWAQEVHGGPFATQVQSVTSTTITLAGPSMTTNQWAGYTISLLAKLDCTVEVPVVNMPITSSTATSGGLFTLTIASSFTTNLTTLLVTGDLLLMRFNPTFTSTSFTDPNIANGFYPNGASDTTVEPGYLACCLSGVNAGDVRTISSTSGTNDTTFNIATPWATTPNTGDLVVILAPAMQKSDGAPMQVQNNLLSGVLMQPSIQNLAALTWFFRVRACDAAGNYCDDSLAPFRELYIFGGGITETITTTQTALPIVGRYLVDTTAANVTLTLLPFLPVDGSTQAHYFANQSLFVEKITSDTNICTIACAAPYTSGGVLQTDYFPDGVSTSYVLSDLARQKNSWVSSGSGSLPSV